MCERGCSAAIYVSHSVTGLTNEIGEWAEGTTASGDFIATVNVHLVTAVRFLVVQRRISRMKEAQRQVDEAAMQTQLGRIKTALMRIATVKRRVGEVRSSETQSSLKARRFALTSGARSSCSRRPSAPRRS